METEEAKITIEGPLQFQMSISKEVALQIVRFISNAATVVPPALQPINGSNKESVFTDEAPNDPVGFLNYCGPKTRQGEILAIAGFLKLSEGKVTFEREDIRQMYKITARAMPKNFNRDFNEVISKGWITTERGSSGRFYVTQPGTDLINSRFEKEFGPRGKRT